MNKQPKLLSSLFLCTLKQNSPRFYLWTFHGNTQNKKAIKTSSVHIAEIFYSPSYMMPILQDVDLIKIVKVGIRKNKVLWLMSYTIPRLGDGVVVYLQSQFSLQPSKSFRIILIVPTKHHLSFLFHSVINSLVKLCQL